MSEPAAYRPEELALVPETARRDAFGLANPLAFVPLWPGASVVDLGCGGGIDLILAAHCVGDQGRVLGIEISPPRLALAREAAAAVRGPHGSFHFKTADAGRFYRPMNFADVLVANFAISHCREKEAVLRNAFRILRPGGRIVIADFVFAEEIPGPLRARLAAAGCEGLAGALAEGVCEQALDRLSFQEIMILARQPLGAGEWGKALCPPGGEGSGSAAVRDLRGELEGQVASLVLSARRPPLGC